MKKEPFHHNDDRLALMDEAAAEAILELLEEHGLAIVREPRTALVMMRVRDAAGIDFNLGEVLVTETEVSWKNRSAYAMVQGNESRKALARAAADLVLQGEPSPQREGLENLLDREWKRLSEETRALQRQVASTMVQFEAMNQW